MAKVLVVGLNPAWQQVFLLRTFGEGQINRAEALWTLGSGKGLNAAKVLARRGHDVALLQVLAGVRGGRCLEECEVRRVRSLHVWAHGETRTCVTLLHEGRATEIISPFAIPDSALHERLLEQVRPQDGYDAVLVCGSLPSGMREEFSGEAAARAAAPLLIWDSVAGLSADVLARVTWLKVNAEEHRALAGLLDIPENSRACPPLLITDGPRPASVRRAGTIVRMTMPPLQAVVNPIGAGDTVTAMLTDGVLGGMAADAAVVRALAAGAASCLNPLPAEWDPEDAARIEKEIRWIES
jgi:fructose-1-phosphate kinase PfkB-like protein